MTVNFCRTIKVDVGLTFEAYFLPLHQVLQSSPSVDFIQHLNAHSPSPLSLTSCRVLTAGPIPTQQTLTRPRPLPQQPISDRGTTYMPLPTRCVQPPQQRSTRGTVPPCIPGVRKGGEWYAARLLRMEGLVSYGVGDGLTGVEGLGEEPRWKTKGFLRAKRVDPGGGIYVAGCV